MASTYTGDSTDIKVRETFQMLHSKLDPQYENLVTYGVFTRTPFLRAMGVEAFGADKMKSADSFFGAKPNGRMIRTSGGGVGFSQPIITTGGTSKHVGRMREITAELLEGGDVCYWTWFTLEQAVHVPTLDVDDNKGGYIDLLNMQQERMALSFIEDFSQAVLGSSSGPDYGVLGPSALYADIPNLISVTQTTGTSIGGIDRAATDSDSNYIWINGYKAVTSIGGGGEVDRPIMIARALMDQMNDQMRTVGSSLDYMLLATQGAWQYLWRQVQADTTMQGVVGKLANYDLAGVTDYYAFRGQPVLWDPNVTMPVGGTASREHIYGIHRPSTGISFKSNLMFKTTPWEAPRVRDQQQTYTKRLTARYTPYTVNRAANFVLYNMPQNTD